MRCLVMFITRVYNRSLFVIHALCISDKQKIVQGRGLSIKNIVFLFVPLKSARRHNCTKTTNIAVQ